MSAKPETATRAEIRLRIRVTVVLFTSAALLNAAMAAVAPASTIFAASVLGTAWGALPQALTILCTGAGALLVARASSYLGWRASLAASYVLATVGGAITFGSVLVGEIFTLCVGMALLGLGVGGAVISRYAAAELYPAHRRGFAIGIVVAAGAVGAIGGRLLLDPVSSLAVHFGWTELAGPFLLATVTSLLGWIGLVAMPGGRVRRTGEPAQRTGLGDLLKIKSSWALLTIMVIAQLVMVAIMTAAPLDIHARHADLTLVGTALAAHTTGMFVLAPLTGWIIDRVGSRPVMYAGLIVLIGAATLAATVPKTNELLPDLALFLLGYGWNLSFVSGSRSLAVNIPTQSQRQVVGAVDGIVWSVSATATMAGTALLALGGYSMLAMITGVLPVAGLTVMLLSRPAAARVKTAAEPPPSELPEAA